MYASGTGTVNRSRRVFATQHGLAGRGSVARADQRARMHVALGHHAGEWRGDPQVLLYLRDRIERLPRRLDILLRGRHLTLIRVDGFLTTASPTAGAVDVRRPPRT